MPISSPYIVAMMFASTVSFVQMQQFDHLAMLQNSVEGLTNVGKNVFENPMSLDTLKQSSLRQNWNLAELVGDWLIPTANYLNASEQCLEDSKLYASSLTNGENWALKMYDASGKMPDGLASFNIHAFGHFDQCLKIQYEEIHGKYCTVFLQTRKVPEMSLNQTDDDNDHGTKSMFGLYRLLTLFGPDLTPIHTDAQNIITYLSPSLAFCLPSSCSADDIGGAIADKISRHPLGNSQLVVALDESYCYTSDSEEKDFDGAAIAVIVILSIIGVLLSLGTTYDSWLRYQQREEGCFSVVSQVLLSFSVLKNGEKILDVRHSRDSLTSLHGIRFFSMTWVVLGHVWLMRTIELNANLKAAYTDARGWAMQVVTNATPSVDTFFFLSGLLVAYIMLKELDKRKGGFNPLMMYLHRYLRLTPVYAIILGFLATLSIYISSGPLWQYVRSYFETGCRRDWWHHLLYINNFYAADGCMGETWYLACDMQMFLLAPFLVYVIWRWTKNGLIILASALIGFIAISMAIIGIENLPPTSMTTRTDINLDYTTDYYFKPYTRIPPYIVGIFFGYLLYKTKGKKVELNYLTVTWGWIIAFVGGVSIIYGMHDYMDPSIVPEIPLAVSVIYGSIHRAAFVTCVGWVVFACENGYGGFVNTLLSWKWFLPLSRLTYCTYLIHLNWITVYYSRMRAVPYYTPLDHSVAFLGHLVISLGLAFIVSTCIEAPFLNLEKLLFTPNKKGM